MKKVNNDMYRCAYCGREYYISKDRIYKWNIHFSTGKLTVVVAILLTVIIVVAIGAYIMRAAEMRRNSQRFSKVFSQFLTEVYDESIAKVDDDDLKKMKYLRIDKTDTGYIFEYSFEDWYDYEEKEFEEKVKRVVVDGLAYSPSNIQYFSGLTRLELYTGVWENYVLPKKNQIRSIYCVDGYSKYGAPEFFTAANPETLEEVVIYEAEELMDYSFVKDISKIKKFVLEEGVLKDVAAFAEFEKLEELHLINPEIKEEKAYEIVETLLSISTLNTFSMEGPCAWYITDEQWSELEQKYGSRVTMERK